MNNSKEVVKKIKSIFEKIKSSCCIDSLVRIDENIYECDKCVLLDTVNTVSTVIEEGIIDKSICPVIMKGEVNDVVR